MATAIAPLPADDALIERFRRAFHDLSELAQRNPAAADLIASTVAASLRSAFPMQHVAHSAPCTSVRVPVGGGVYELTAEENGLLVYVQEASGKDAALLVPAEAFCRDAIAVGKAVR